MRGKRIILEREKGGYILDQLNGIKKVPISGSGHFMMIDNPQELYQKLRGVLP
ncbi:hypothetical protein KY326_01485 [Candidatus Woesearchaeota archaeon]|nr:hypothetical protein [Candidatus Woesearchaeota archaeon]